MKTEIYQFARAMEIKMSKHEKDRGDRWKNESIKWLFDRLTEEVNEANECIQNLNSSKFCDELLDIANFAMMAYYITKTAQK